MPASIGQKRRLNSKVILLCVTPQKSSLDDLWLSGFFLTVSGCAWTGAASRVCFTELCIDRWAYCFQILDHSDDGQNADVCLHRTCYRILLCTLVNHNTLGTKYIKDGNIDNAGYIAAELESGEIIRTFFFFA